MWCDQHGDRSILPQHAEKEECKTKNKLIIQRKSVLDAFIGQNSNRNEHVTVIINALLRFCIERTFISIFHTTREGNQGSAMEEDYEGVDAYVFNLFFVKE